jgi:hypothetical protein
VTEIQIIAQLHLMSKFGVTADRWWFAATVSALAAMPVCPTRLRSLS